MPIKIADGLSAKEKLHEEGIFTIDKGMALHQDIRPLRILILNLMPLKKPTELQLLRLLGDSPLQVEVDFCHTETHESTHTDPSYLEENYYVFDEIKDNYYDGFIITGAPVEQIPFESVDYWPEMMEIMEWTKTHVHSTLHICWGAQAGLYYHYGIPKRVLDHKLFGVFEHTVEDPNYILFRGFDDTFWVPHSRNTTVDRADIEAVPELKILAASPEAGVYAVKTDQGRQVFLMGHAEYDRDTLRKEYVRDLAAGVDIQIPKHYFPGDDPEKMPVMNWRSCAHLLYANWLNYCVYQTSPYDIRDIEKGVRTDD